MAENHVSKRRPIARKPRRHQVDEGLVVRFSATPIPLMCCRLYGEVCFLQEDSEWKLIHGHSSIGVSNEEMFGKDVTA
jgi:hypothetical protein